jgi:uncharacterized protein (DUF58 family)
MIRWRLAGGKPMKNSVKRPAASEESRALESLARVRTLELRTRWLVDSILAGEYRSVFTGRGMEFSHVRPYQPGDDIRRIDWKVTARRGGAPYIRQFVEERDLPVMLVVDVSGSELFGPGERAVSDVAIEVAAALAFAAVRNNDRVGLILVSDRVELFITPASGRRHVLGMLVRLVSHRPHGSGTNLATGIEQAERITPGRGMVFLISDFIQSMDDERYRGALGRVARRHDLVAVRLTNRASRELPDAGWLELLDPESGRRTALNTGRRHLRERYRKLLNTQSDGFAGMISEAGIGLVEVDTDTDPLVSIAGFFRRRRG